MGLGANCALCLLAAGSGTPSQGAGRRVGECLFSCPAPFSQAWIQSQGLASSLGLTKRRGRRWAKGAFPSPQCACFWRTLFRAA